MMAPIVFYHLGSTACHTSTNGALGTKTAAWQSCRCSSRMVFLLTECISCGFVEKIKGSQQMQHLCFAAASLQKHPYCRSWLQMFLSGAILLQPRTQDAWDKHGSQRAWSRNSAAIRFEMYQRPRGMKWAHILCKISCNYVRDATNEKWLKRK